ncbi:hypothetical protein ShirakiTB12_54280 [Priestia megaterium]|uniref:Uncharacterized protein n=1 Tax=Priestia megaterium TaxID=1404 RepID=A0AAX6BTG7_PRIMG|nr:hypothetical protein ShirakiTB12_54280 [Priestia megaterium]
MTQNRTVVTFFYFHLNASLYECYIISLYTSGICNVNDFTEFYTLVYNEQISLWRTTHEKCKTQIT